MSRKLLIFEITVLTAVFSLFAYIAFFTTTHPLFGRTLATAVPENVPGWVSKTIKLSNTEVGDDLVREVLKFDQYTYRAYANRKNWVTVYVAYWKPGKVTTTDAGVHNPDSCWVNAGCERITRVHNKTITIAGKKLKPLEYGEYLSPVFNSPPTGRVLHRVLFWHLVGGEINSYENQKTGFRSGLFGRLDRLPLFLKDIRKYGLNQRREQMFIRLEIPRPIDELENDRDFANLLEALRPLGIFDGDSWEQKSI
jgi:hypothetical protein